MSPRTRPASPEDVRKIVAHAQEHKACRDCGAAPGGPCTQPGRGRTVCKSRYIAAAIAIRRQTKAEQRSPEREAEIAWPRHPSRYRCTARAATPPRRGPRHERRCHRARGERAGEHEASSPLPALSRCPPASADQSRYPVPAFGNWRIFGPPSAGEVRAGEVRADEGRVREVGADEGRAGEIHANEARPGEIGLGEAHAGKFRAREVDAGKNRAKKRNASESRVTSRRPTTVMAA